jgi:hypothetical protein
MTRHFLAAIATATLLAGVPATAQQVVPISFAKGKSAATVTGSIKGDQDRSYTVDARAGQTMTVTLKSTKGSTEMNVWAPGNDTALTVGALDPYKFTTTLSTTGRYRIQVYQMRASARRGETASYNLTIAITGGAKASTDALVPGTRYNATADVSCIVTPGGKPGACKAGVIRKGAGNAVVEMQTPDGGQRSITFTGGKASSSNAAGAKMTATRREDDITIVRIGASEVYYIPDAFVFGG